LENKTRAYARRKSELIFNVTKEVLPGAKVIYYDYGASYWLPTGSTDGCFNVPPGKTNASFAPFYTENDHFTKTGSGQAQDKLKKDAFLQAAVYEGAVPARLDLLALMGMQKR
jgi:hypothetical protein